MPSAVAEPDTVHLVTGGGGYPGFNLGRKLAQSGKQVILVDIIQPRWPLEENMKFIQVKEFGFTYGESVAISDGYNISDS